MVGLHRSQISQSSTYKKRLGHRLPGRAQQTAITTKWKDLLTLHHGSGHCLKQPPAGQMREGAMFVRLAHRYGLGDVGTIEFV